MNVVVKALHVYDPIFRAPPASMNEKEPENQARPMCRLILTAAVYTV